jgi:hypothetical protein
MALRGWQALVETWPWFSGPDTYPIDAYSEFLPPPRLGRKPYGPRESSPFREEDPWGWDITEYEEALGFRPGMTKLAHQLLEAMTHLSHGRPYHGISKGKLAGNRYWPEELARHAGDLAHERHILLVPLALSRTQDDKGRVLWTVFGNSEQGPARPFWRGFFSAPGWELPEEQSLNFLRRLLAGAYAEPEDKLTDLRKAGLRILPLAKDDVWDEGPLPQWTKPLLWQKGQAVRGVRYLLTFRPFAQLPASVQKAYLAGQLHLLPFPGSLLFWGIEKYQELGVDLPLAVQVPLLQVIGRHEGWHGLRVPQSGWMHEPKPGHEGDVEAHGPVRNTFKRTHRWARVLRHEDELAMTEKEDKVVRVLFSAQPDDLGLYGKPMARNAQMWTHDFKPLLDGPRAVRDDLDGAMHAVHQGGLFGYRFQYPAMRVGRHEVYWHRPLVAWPDAAGNGPVVLTDAPTAHGYLTAYDADKPDPKKAIELWPRFLQREPHLAAVRLAEMSHTHHPYQACLNVRKLLDTHEMLGDVPMRRSLGRRLLTCAKHETLEEWFEALPKNSPDPAATEKLVQELRRDTGPVDEPLPEALTYERTATRPFEVNYWKTIAFLAEGKFLNKNNADCVRDPQTQKQLCHHRRDLDPLGDYLLEYYRKAVAAAKMGKKALVGDLPFRWRTDFHYVWSGGWMNNREGELEERDLIVVIPGRDRSRAVIMGDHYDTAYMLDRYDPQYGGNGARIAACGADDNHSATAAMMLAAPIFLEMSRQGRLGCDIWLIHLTGEEFPADCLGARHLSQSLVEGTLHMRLADGSSQDLSETRIQGLYVSDMIAHNNEHDRDVFQISPGTIPEAMWLAKQAHLAAEIWNAGTERWNRRPSRKNCDRGRRSPHGGAIPETAKHLRLHGEIRPAYDPRSTLFNTDGQVFSDAGIPAVLFMENYDINRTGYHDTHDTMENIDLDYGAAVAAITIESVARAATEKPES